MTVIDQEAVAVAADGKGHVEFLGVGECLLHTVTDSVLVVFGFDHGDGLGLLIAEHVVSAARLLTAVHAATDDDTTVTDREFFVDLGVDVPSCTDNGRGYELGADVLLCQLFLIHEAPGTR